MVPTRTPLDGESKDDSKSGRQIGKRELNCLELSEEHLVNKLPTY